MARKSQYPPSVNPGIPKEQKPPIGWKLVRFGDVFKVVERPAKLQDEDEYQLVTAKRNRGGIIPREKLLGKEILTKNQYYLKSGDFLISRRQIIHGACGIVPESLEGAVVSNEYSTLLPTNDILLEYLSYYSYTAHFQQTCFHSSIGVDVEKMVFKIEDWLHHKMPLPPISEQEMICTILDSVDDAIQATKTVVDQAQRVKQGLMQQLFTHGIGHTKFKQTEIGEIPEDWSEGTIGDYLKEIKGGGTPSRKKPIYWGGKIPWASVKDLNDGHHNNTEEYITEEGLYNSSSNLIPAGTVIIATRMALGKVIRFSCDVAINQDLKALFPQKELSSDFLVYWLLLQASQIEALGAGSTVKGIRLEALRALKLVLPPIEEQKKIAFILTNVDKILKVEQDKMLQLQKIKKGLMQDLLTGRVRVKLNEEVAI